MVTVADCERVQFEWFRARALLLGGQVYTEGAMTWTDGPDGLNLMFPTIMTVEGLRSGVDRARDRGPGIVGAWLGLEADASPLAEAGFERGWAPHWMTAELSAVPDNVDPRIELQQDSEDYTGEYAQYQEQLALARQQPIRTWYAAAYEGEEELAGRAWAFRAAELAGIFDMDVWPEYQRRGFGTGLLSAVCAAARASGARHAVLNATPEGEMLYSTCGFRKIGEGITWWHHLNSA